MDRARKRRSPPTAGTAVSAYGANRPTTSPIAELAAATRLCVPLAVLRRAEVGEDNPSNGERERGEVADTTVYALRVLLPLLQ